MQPIQIYPREYLVNESFSLLSRIGQLKPFVMTMPMVKGAAVSPRALKEITDLLEKGKSVLYKAIKKYIHKVQSATQDDYDPRELQSEFTLLKMRYNNILDQLDIFADVLSQRAEHGVGIWLSGLDILAEDGLVIAKSYVDPPPLMVFLERGHGAAIRRARTRLPGGDLNPVAVIQIPRERMVGSGIASSLIHEVGHQAAESLDLTKSLRVVLSQKLSGNAPGHDAWRCFEKWISEILADYWAMGHLGITASLGLMGVVTLPSYFQFRLDLDDPHPAPYMRVKISCAFGKSMFPHIQWDRIWKLWQLFYPTEGLPVEKINLLKELDEHLDEFVSMVNEHRAPSLKGKRLIDIFPLAERQPQQLQLLYRHWRQDRSLMDKAPPTLVFAVLGQAKSDMVIQAIEESRMLEQQLRNWAYNRN